MSSGSGPAAEVRPHGTERILYALAWHLRRGDPAAADDLVAALSPAERAEAQAVMDVPGVAETLRTLSETELRRRMIDLGGKTREAHVGKPQREVTTILPGSAAEGGTIVVRDHDGWRAQVEAEKRRKQDEEIKAAVDRIERERVIREFAPPPKPDVVEQALAEPERRKWLRECAEARDLPRRQAELEEWARKVELERAMDPPDPPPPMRYGRPLSKAQLAYEEQQAAWQAKQARLPGGGCGYCNTCRAGGGQWCLYG